MSFFSHIFFLSLFWCWDWTRAPHMTLGKALPPQPPNHSCGEKWIRTRCLTPSTFWWSMWGVGVEGPWLWFRFWQLFFYPSTVQCLTDFTILLQLCCLPEGWKTNNLRGKMKLGFYKTDGKTKGRHGIWDLLTMPFCAIRTSWFLLWSTHRFTVISLARFRDFW